MPRKFQVHYSIASAVRLMHRLGFSPQVPPRWAAKREEQAVTAFRSHEGAGAAGGRRGRLPLHRRGPQEAK
ncbi:winged helix-turn-helix domain-containing protein [Streptomyces sp900105245]|uniref:Winged helix-turn-helix domain-containing protein n=1 Tax=Streptomyces sp. 900105245 TaxID=3154379 RepID=A0ABV1ULF4_9ACTN